MFVDIRLRSFLRPKKEEVLTIIGARLSLDTGDPFGSETDSLILSCPTWHTSTTVETNNHVHTRLLTEPVGPLFDVSVLAGLGMHDMGVLEVTEY